MRYALEDGGAQAAEMSSGKLEYCRQGPVARVQVGGYGAYQREAPNSERLITELWTLDRIFQDKAVLNILNIVP